MRGDRPRVAVAFLAILTIIIVFLSARTSFQSGSETDGTLPTVSSLPVLASLGFTENAGQVANAGIRFYSASGPVAIGFAESTVLFEIQKTPVRAGPDSKASRWPIRASGSTGS